MVHEYTFPSFRIVDLLVNVQGDAGALKTLDFIQYVAVLGVQSLPVCKHAVAQCLSVARPQGHLVVRVHAMSQTCGYCFIDPPFVTFAAVELFKDVLLDLYRVVFTLQTLAAVPASNCEICILLCCGARFGAV